MTVNGFAENFGPAVEAVCLALLAALGLWLCCRGLDRAYRGLKAQLGGDGSTGAARSLIRACPKRPSGPPVWSFEQARLPNRQEDSQCTFVSP